MDSLHGQPNPESRVRAEHIDRSIVCDYMETGLFAIVCDPRSSAIVCDHMETSLKKSFLAVTSSPNQR